MIGVGEGLELGREVEPRVGEYEMRVYPFDGEKVAGDGGGSVDGAEAALADDKRRVEPVGGCVDVDQRVQARVEDGHRAQVVVVGVDRRMIFLTLPSVLADEQDEEDDKSERGGGDCCLDGYVVVMAVVEEEEWWWIGGWRRGRERGVHG